MLKLLTMWINKLWKAFKEMRIIDHLKSLLRNLHAIQEATVRNLYGTTELFRIEKGGQACLLSLCLLEFYREQIMRDARLNELQTGIKTAGRNINEPHTHTHTHTHTHNGWKENSDCRGPGIGQKNFWSDGNFPHLCCICVCMSRIEFLKPSPPKLFFKKYGNIEANFMEIWKQTWIKLTFKKISNFWSDVICPYLYCICVYMHRIDFFKSSPPNFFYNVMEIWK